MASFAVCPKISLILTFAIENCKFSGEQSGLYTSALPDHTAPFNYRDAQKENKGIPDNSVFPIVIDQSFKGVKQNWKMQLPPQ